jgi:hypothetical protein
MDGSIRVTVNEMPLPHVILHSPTGFEWGYGGSGPADLSLSILANFFNERPTEEQLYYGHCRCLKQHQSFKWALIADAPKNGFELQAYENGLFLRTDSPKKSFQLELDPTAEPS